MLAMLATLLTAGGQPELREVEFRYRPTQAVRSVCVVGQFNDWDRAKSPMALAKDGKTWTVRVPIEPGVYHYLFCEEGKRWLPDPEAPKVHDGNGNVNSVLVVAPLAYDERPGAVGDGHLTEAALLHRPDPSDTARVSRSRYWVRLRTRAHDVESVAVHLEDARAFALRKVRGDELYDYWQGRLTHAGRHPARYSFRLRDGGREWTYRPDEGPFRQDLAAYPLPKVPDWTAGAVFYQIFPDRFENGDPTNDPPDVQPWGTPPTPTNRMGGDLVGIRKRLPYLRELGITALYLNPVFKAGSNHAYDTHDYLQVDPRFGTNDELKALVEDAHRVGIRVVLDAVFNHSSPEFFAFKDLRERGEASAYKAWYHVLKLPIVVGEGQKTYRTFAGVPTMPKLDTDHPEVRDYFCRVGVHWIEQAGIDGWRLDVADAVSQDFWRAFRKEVKRVKPDAFILGEVWGDAHEWLRGDQHDAVMNYRWREATLDFFAHAKTTPTQFEATLRALREDYPDATLHAMYNLLGSHDTPRARTVFGDPRRHALAVVFQFTYPGLPGIYYGDEVGMEGGKDPDDRRCMIWNRRAWDRPFFELHKRLIELRKARPSLHRGRYRALGARNHPGLFAFERRSEDERTAVYLNNSDRPLALALPHPSAKPLLLSQATLERGSLHLPPYAYAILSTH